MNRQDSLRRAQSEPGPWDVVVIGGGATGLGTALDAVSRGFRTLVLEGSDFSKATSSRSTKLSHGGVRYLQQGNLKLVIEALKERGRMLRNAPHVVRRQSFIIPAFAAWEIPFYGVGLKLYDALAGREGIGRSGMLGKEAVHAMLPTVDARKFAGGVKYFDGQFDDARYSIALAQTIEDHGGTALNYAPVTGLLKTNGKVSGVTTRDGETGDTFEVQARVVVNATGVFTDEVRRLDEPEAAVTMTLSQGSHLVLPASFLPGRHALMVPKTEDGRVLFAIPWHGAVVVGTTDREVPAASLEPKPLVAELAFIKHHIGLYFGRIPADAEILSVWSGLRPLVRRAGTKGTAKLSREHTIMVSPAGLVSVTGGKWTTYRRMAEDTIDIATATAGLPKRPSGTAEMRLHGWSEAGAWQAQQSDAFAGYGCDSPAVDQLASSDPQLAEPLHPRLPYRMAEVVWAARHEMARTLDDVLARRTRALFLDARATIEAAPKVAACLAEELHQNKAWQAKQLAAFSEIATQYVFGS